MPSSVGVDGGESLQAAGDVRGKRRLADVLQALQLTDQNPVGKKLADFDPTAVKLLDFLYILYNNNNYYDIVFCFFYSYLEHQIAIK